MGRIRDRRPRKFNVVHDDKDLDNIVNLRNRDAQWISDENKELGAKLLIAAGAAYGAYKGGSYAYNKYKDDVMNKLLDMSTKVIEYEEAQRIKIVKYASERNYNREDSTYLNLRRVFSQPRKDKGMKNHSIHMEEKHIMEAENAIKNGRKEELKIIIEYLTRGVIDVKRLNELEKNIKDSYNKLLNISMPSMPSVSMPSVSIPSMPEFKLLERIRDFYSKLIDFVSTDVSLLERIKMELNKGKDLMGKVSEKSGANRVMSYSYEMLLNLFKEIKEMISKLRTVKEKEKEEEEEEE